MTAMGATHAGAATPTPVAPEPAASAASAAPAPRRVLISGHSLVDQPLPDQLAAIAQSLGTPFDWNRQYLVGSSIRERTAGNPAAGPWNGYRSGANREGQNLDLLRELRTAGASPEPYDTLLITEQHSLLGTLVWNDTVRHLRHFHDRFIEANAKGQTWFYESWLGIDDKGDPRRWIAYEREASKVWQCIATRINVSLEAEGRGDRIASLPAGQALAHLISRATSGGGLPGIGSGAPQDTRATVNSLVRDDVHLTPLGSYYVALVSYAAMFDRSPVGAWAPEGVGTEQAASLQRTAAEFIAGYRSSKRALTLGECRSLLQRSFIGDYWAYVRDTTWRPKEGTFSAYSRWAWTRAQWHWRFSRDNAQNPFHFDATTDKAYWLPKPG